LVAADRASVQVFVGRQGVELFLVQKQKGVDPFQGLILGVGSVASGTADEDVLPQNERERIHAPFRGLPKLKMAEHSLLLPPQLTPSSRKWNYPNKKHYERKRRVKISKDS